MSSLDQKTSEARVVAALLALAALLAPVAAEAGGFHISIIGGRRNGMLANLAAPDDMTAIFHNPAGLADLPGWRLHGFGSVTFLSNEFRLMALDPERFPEINPAGCGESGASACPWPVGEDGYYERAISPESSFGILPFLGVSTDLGFVNPSLERLVLSLAVYAPNAYGGSLPMDAPTAYFMTDGYFVVASATVGLGYRVNRYLSIGMNVSYNYMRMRYGQRLSFVDVLTPEGHEPDSVSRLVQEVYGDVLLDYVGVDHGAGFTASMLLTPLPELSIGLSWAANMGPTFGGEVTLVPTREGQESLADLETLGFALPRRLEVGMPIPPAIGLGVAVRPADWIEVGVDLRLWLYTLYNHQRISPIYDEDQAGVRPMTEESLSKDKNYDLSYEIALGVLVRPFRRLPGLELMVGGGYDQSPVPDEHFSLDNPALSQGIFSAGVRWRIGDHFRLTAAYMGIVYLERDITTSQTSPPTNVRGRGYNHIPSLELEYRF